jgi:L,D-transpeptidase catalytic domain
MKSRLFKRFNLFFTSLFVFLLHIPFVFAKARPDINCTSIILAQQSSEQIQGQNLLSQPLSESVEAPNVYDSLRLGSSGLTRQAYDCAIRGFNTMKETGRLENSNIISIVDFSRPSYQKRLFVIDLKNYRLLFNTYVAHGMNSGREYASQFSNLPESNKSSLGFYTTLSTYTGKHGYSLHLQGIERGINDNAYQRDIVIHGAGYVSESMINEQGFIGRSQGCPAVPERLHKPIIDKIKNGTCLFIYGADKKYLAHSKLLKVNAQTSLAVK